jgi:hypothetical protein
MVIVAAGRTTAWHMNICTLQILFNTFIKMVYFSETFTGWMSILHPWVPGNHEFTYIFILASLSTEV